MNTGPFLGENSPVLGEYISVPTTSAGRRSGVKDMRLKSRPSTLASVLTLSVFARPGTPSSRMCPSVTRASTSLFISLSWPTMTLPTSSVIFLTSSPCAAMRFVAFCRSILLSPCLFGLSLEIDGTDCSTRLLASR